MSHRSRRITIVYRRIEFVTWITSIVTWNLSHGYRRLSPHRICHVDIVYRHIVIVYCHIVIVYRRIDVVTCSSSHSATFRATVHNTRVCNKASLSPINERLLSFNTNQKPRIKSPKRGDLQNKNYIGHSPDPIFSRPNIKEKIAVWLRETML